MKILHTVESYLPDRHGMSVVVNEISERLVSAGHEVTVATRKNPSRSSSEINGVKIVDFNIWGNSVSGINGETDTYQDYLLNSKFDIVTNFAAQQWATDLALPLLSQISGKKVFVPTGFSQLNNPNFAKYYEMLAKQMKLYDANVFHSTEYQDVQFARKIGVSSIVLIPNGASEIEFCSPRSIDIRKKLKIPESSFIVLHVGTLSGLKGHEQAVKLFNRSNLPNSVLLLVSDSFPSSQNSSFRHAIKKLLSAIGIFKGKYDHLIGLETQSLIKNMLKRQRIINLKLSRNETVDAFKQSDLFLFPSMTECSPIVLFEAMAGKIPFLVTDVGNAREIIRWSGGGELMPTDMGPDHYSHVRISNSVPMIEALYHSKEKRKSLAESGYFAWTQKFTWKIIAKKYEELYSSLANSKSIELLF